jgi:hypothetical protein
MSKLPLNFWTATPIKPAPVLAELREMVLARSERRSPKWKFRLAPDLVVQIQAKLTTALLKFDCIAVQCERAHLEVLLTSRREIQRPYWRLSFELRANTPDQWTLKPHYVGWKRNCDPLAVVTARDQVIAAFQEGRFDKLEPAMLLGSHCLCCGKGLTDPVSQARHIGPECAGTSLEQLPFVLRITDTQQAASSRLTATPSGAQPGSMNQQLELKFSGE